MGTDWILVWQYRSDAEESALRIHSPVGYLRLPRPATWVASKDYVVGVKTSLKDRWFR
jgi:hypothetical protein